MRDLSRHVLLEVATRWYDLGLELFDAKYEKYLEIIDEDNRSVESCCRKMFSKWLESKQASWDQLINALKTIEMDILASKVESLLLQGILVQNFSLHSTEVDNCNLYIYIKLKNCLSV